MDFRYEPASSLDAINAERCIAELRRGRAIALKSPPSEGSLYHVVQLVETLSQTELESLMKFNACQLILSRARARALNILADCSAVCLELAPQTSVKTLQEWAGLNPSAIITDLPKASTHVGGSREKNTDVATYRQEHYTCDLQSAKAALNLAHHAHVLPAFIMYSANQQPEHMLSLSIPAALKFQDHSGELIRLSQARIPLQFAENVELTVFRERHGNAEHVAIKVGDPDLSKTVTVRVHSSCFTGDILGSMKCDCGEQLQRAISTMASGEGGIVLYISQEGRGIGLSSKLLAYQLQDQGLDTIEANQQLGFEADERRYPAAAHMLEQMGVQNIRLMTNNPLKIAALREHGINVLGRIPSPATTNIHNARYLETKRERAGHLTSSEPTG